MSDRRTPVVCTRGRLWLATRHDRAVWPESAGRGLPVADAGPTHRQPAGEITAALAAAELTDDELALGPDGWRDLPDPFGGRHEDPCVAPAPGDDDSAHATTREEHS